MNIKDAEINCDTDKFTSGLIKEYIDHFGPGIHRKIKLLEVGTLKGGSLKFWDEYFLFHPDSRIYGIDINPRGGQSSRITLTKGSQDDTKYLRRFADQYGPFDIIIDDASHRMPATEITFDALWPYVVKDTGWYIIEDFGCDKATHDFVYNKIGSKYKMNVRIINNAKPLNTIGFFQPCT